MKPEVRQTLERYFGEHAEAAILSAYLFGSHAAGRAHRESDVDVAVLLDRSHYPSVRERAEATRCFTDRGSAHGAPRYRTGYSDTGRLRWGAGPAQTGSKQPATITEEVVRVD